MRKPTEQTLAKIRQAASLRVEGAAWETVASQIGGYSSAESCRTFLTGRHPDVWGAEYERARQLYLDEVEGEAILTQRGLLRSAEERIRQSAAQSLLAHCAKLRSQKVEISGLGQTPLKVYLSDLDDA